MARPGKLSRLVADFVATVEELGGHIDPASAAEAINARIDLMAQKLRVTRATVIRSYLEEEWGRELAAKVMADRAAATQTLRSRPPEHVAVAVAGRLLAGLGQAVLYATINDDSLAEYPALDLEQAAKAISGLGLAISEATDTTQIVAVDFETVAWTRATLQALHTQFASGAWTSCSCGEPHGQAELDASLTEALALDLLLLPAEDRTAG